MRPYKLITGYGIEDYIEINGDELEKAQRCFLEKMDGVFSGGAIRGVRIQEIKPDYHRAMGWNRGHKLELLDYQELSQKGLDRDLTDFLSLTKDKVQYLLETNQKELIGKNVDVTGFIPKKIAPPRVGGMKSIGEMDLNKNKNEKS